MFCVKLEEFTGSPSLGIVLSMELSSCGLLFIGQLTGKGPTLHGGECPWLTVTDRCLHNSAKHLCRGAARLSRHIRLCFCQESGDYDQHRECAVLFLPSGGDCRENRPCLWWNSSDSAESLLAELSGSDEWPWAGEGKGVLDLPGSCELQ